MILFDLHPQINAANSSPAKRVGGAAHGYASQPEAGVLWRLDPVHISVQLQKDILGNLFGQTAVAGHSPRERKHHGLMLVHELFEIRLPIVGHCARFYSLIRRGTRVGMQKVRAGDEKVQAEWFCHLRRGAL